MPSNFICGILWGLDRDCVAPEINYVCFLPVTWGTCIIQDDSPPSLLSRYRKRQEGEGQDVLLHFQARWGRSHSLLVTIPEPSHMILHTHSDIAGWKMSFYLLAQLKILCNMVTHILVNNRTHIWTHICMIPKLCPFYYIMLPFWEEVNRKLFFNRLLRTLRSPSQ